MIVIPRTQVECLFFADDLCLLVSNLSLCRIRACLPRFTLISSRQLSKLANKDKTSLNNRYLIASTIVKIKEVLCIASKLQNCIDSVTSFF
jgi:hypothetical protein